MSPLCRGRKTSTPAEIDAVDPTEATDKATDTATQSDEAMAAEEKKKPGIVDRFKERWPWFAHLLATHERFKESGAKFYAGGITYFSVLGIFPTIMLAFSIAGIILVRRPDLLGQIQDQIVLHIPGGMGEQISDIIHTAIEQRSTVGIIGVLTAFASGVLWIRNLRDGLTAQWTDEEHPAGNIVLQLIRDVIALLGLFLSFALALAISALGSSGIIEKILSTVYVDRLPGVSFLLTLVSLLLALLAMWLISLWVIGFLPRERAELKVSIRAALLSSVMLMLWIQVAAFYLKKVLSSPAGAIFGPIIGIMVFLFFTWQILLFCAAWAATAPSSEEAEEDENAPTPELAGHEVIVEE